LLGSLDAGELRSRFLDLQAGFVDEPRQAVEEAARFVDDLVRQVADAIQEQRRQLGGATAEGSTEELRLTLRAYRQFVDRLLGMAG
jgi:polyhydroxyalkanoate synthesis regulator phasin